MRNKSLIKRAKQLRKIQTPEELKIWRLLRDRRFANYKFRRQLPVDKYIVDFCCLEERLIIELDGGHHNQKFRIPYERERKRYLEAQGFRVLRIWNSEINQNIDGVRDKILELLEEPLIRPAATFSRKGRRTH